MRPENTCTSRVSPNARPVVHRVTLDSNIYVSALQFRGLPLRLIEMAGNAEIEIAISEPILSEVVTILAQHGEIKILRAREFMARSAPQTPIK